MYIVDKAYLHHFNQYVEHMKWWSMLLERKSDDKTYAGHAERMSEKEGGVGFARSWQNWTIAIGKGRVWEEKNECPSPPKIIIR